jgi:hypothetical protein
MSLSETQKGSLSMDRRKTLSNEYKQRKIIGGVFRVVNTRNKMYFLDYAVDIQAKQNAFIFMVSYGSCFHYKLQKDWDTFGGEAFTFEVLETIEKKKDQSQAEFLEDLKMLAQLWTEKLNPMNRY